MIVVSDTSAITALMQIGREELLLQIYSGVVVPEAVAEELNRAYNAIPGFISVLRVQDRQRITRLAVELDIGEAEAIALMLERRGDILLIDERRGRSVARREGVPFIGLVGVLIEARRRGLIDSLRAIFERLQTSADFRLSEELKRQALKAAGEKTD